MDKAQQSPQRYKVVAGLHGQTNRAGLPIIRAPSQRLPIRQRIFVQHPHGQLRIPQRIQRRIWHRSLQDPGVALRPFAY